MEIKALFGILSSVMILIGGLPYLRDIYNKKAQPHILSWLGWAFITTLGGFAMLADGSTWTVVILFANSLLCITIALYALYKKVGVWSATKYDISLFVIGIIGLVLWQTLDLPVVALVCAIVADISFGLPTLLKAYQDPSSETYFVWFTAFLSGLFSLFAITSFTFSDSAYPIYLFLYDTSVLLVVLRIIKKKDSVVL